MPRLAVLPSIGQRVDRYEVIDEIGHGGMAVVYAVRRRVGGFDKPLALKVLLPHLAADRSFVAMFLDEANIAAQIQHPHVVSVFDVGEHEGLPFLVMELLRGRSLTELVASGPLPPAHRLRILAAAARGLHGAHEARDATGRPLGVVHRDVSPQNIHVGYDGAVKIVDFGVAWAANKDHATRAGELKGKPRYFAPEQVKGRAVDRRTDAFAFGIVAWELVTGAPLFAGQSDADTLWNVLHQSVPDPTLRCDWLPYDVADAITQCLDRDVDRRPSSLAEVAAVLEAGAASLPDPGPLEALLRERFGAAQAAEAKRFEARPVRPSPSRWWLVAAALLIPVLGALGWAFARPDAEPPAPVVPPPVAAEVPAPPPVEAAPAPAPVAPPSELPRETVRRRARTAPAEAPRPSTEPEERAPVGHGTELLPMPI